MGFVATFSDDISSCYRYRCFSGDQKKLRQSGGNLVANRRWTTRRRCCVAEDQAMVDSSIPLSPQWHYAQPSDPKMIICRSGVLRT
ncbi:hypothetical protein HAX54_039983 [Datura stramonium]|uniref:Uncharacterized protein n=1 Tax=Datura stramonium TaxID=4076 RepID=A0ABS8RNN0_DATST|nr:hypothetical protein [Datura stramonium]